MLPEDEESSSKQSQKCDSSFKNWITQQAPAILPLLMLGVEYERAVKVEVIPSVMRADKVFRVPYYLGRRSPASVHTGDADG